MNSNITLTLKDPKLQVEYNMKRSKEILQMSILVQTFVIIANTIVIVLSIVNSWNEYILELWLGRIIGFIINTAIIVF